VRDQQKLYARAHAAAARIAKAKGMDVYNVTVQLEQEAKRRGALMPMPGRDI
jgi:hypothetical protein